MKIKAKTYKGKRVVMGDKNLVTKNEIHVNDIPGNEGYIDDGMEYYLVLDGKDLSFTLEHTEFPKLMGCMSTIIPSSRASEYNTLIMGTQTSYELKDYIAFSTSVKFLTDVRENISVKQYLINIFTKNGVSLDDTSKFKKITAKEYYSLIGK